jgi:hypothetical protein
MKQLAIPLSLVAVAALGGCMTYEATRPADTFPRASISAQPVAYVPGQGTITQVTASPSYYGTAAAGTTAPRTSSIANSAGANISGAGSNAAYKRLVIRMDSGATQYIDTDSNDFRTGMRVEVLPDHTIRPL